MTMLSSFGGGCVGLCHTLLVQKGQIDIMDIINSVLGALVAITGKFIYINTTKTYSPTQYYLYSTQ